MSFVVQRLRGRLAAFKDEQHALKEQYDAGFADGSDGRDPVTQEVAYQDGWLDGYERHAYLPPPLAT